MRSVQENPSVRRWIFSFPSQNSPRRISPNPFRYSTQLRLKLRDPSKRCIKTIQLFMMGGRGPSGKLIPKAIETGTKCTVKDYVTIILRHCRLHVSTRCLRKHCSKLFLSEFRQISISFNNCWQVDGKLAEMLFYKYIFHLTSLMLSHYLLNKHKSTKFYNFLGKTVKIFCQNFVVFT